MTFKFNGITLDNSTTINCDNHTDIGKLQLNGVTVWEKQSVPSGTVIFNSSTAGTYTVNIPVDGNYQIIAVGGGGEGGTYLNYTMQVSSYGYGGGYINVYANLTSGSYTAVVGATHKQTPQNTTFSTFQAGGGHIYYMGTSGAQFNVITNNVSDAYQVNSNVTTITVSGSNYGSYGKGANTYSADGSTPGYLRIVKL